MRLIALIAACLALTALPLHAVEFEFQLCADNRYWSECPPDLSGPSVNPDETTATLNITTDVAGGTLRCALTGNASETDLAVVDAGGLSQAVSSPGVQVVPISGLSAETAYNVHCYHERNGRPFAPMPGNEYIVSTTFVTDASGGEPGEGGVLADAAAALSVGHWSGVITMNGLEAALTNAGSSGHIITFQGNAYWDPVTRKIALIGGDHNGGGQEYAEYSESTNTWSRPSSGLPSSGAQSHAYYKNTGRPGFFLYGDDGERNLTTGAETGLSNIGCCSGAGHESSFAYVRGIGHVMYSDGFLYRRTPPATSFSLVTSSGIGGAILESVIAPNPVKKQVIFGGGNGSENLWVMDTNDLITNLGASTPIASDITMSGNNSSYLSVDPTTGETLIWNGTENDLWSLDTSDPSNPIFTQLPDIPSPITSFGGNVTIDDFLFFPISTYGVHMLIRYANSDPDVVTARLYKHAAPIEPEGDCSNEDPLRSDLVFCEPFDSASWFTDVNWRDSARGPIDVNVDIGTSPNGWNTSIVSQTDEGVPCVSGTCLRVGWNNGAGGGPSLKWLIEDEAYAAFIASNGNDELYLSYNIFLSPDWNPDLDQGSNGGKFPGMADERIFSDPSGQCGNGGDFSDGVDCWSGRASWYWCDDAGDGCTADTQATTRIGVYAYLKGANQLPAHFDSDPQHQFGSCGTEAGLNCGIGSAGMLRNGQWYRYTQRMKMNTAGVANGVIEGWVDGQLAYRKTNVLFRDNGHDDLSIKTVWLDVFLGGTGDAQANMEVYLDELVLSHGGRS